jgi:endonuclease III
VTAKLPVLPQLLAVLKKAYPQVSIPLTHRNPFELLAATILSAQCTDVRVNQVTPALFKIFPDAGRMAKARPARLERLIRSTGFYHNKAKSLLGMSRLLVQRFAGRVPRTMDELLLLPGVARKTANVVLGGAFGVTAGVVVDTHVLRLSRRLGLTAQTAPEKVERDLMGLLPRTEWNDFSLRLIYHGRQVCFARKPNCAGCTLNVLCPSAFNV